MRSSSKTKKAAANPQEGKTILIITRSKGDVIHIGDNITAKILKCKDGTVVIGFEAPRDIDIGRNPRGNIKTAKQETANEKPNRRSTLVLKSNALSPRKQSFKG